MGWVTFMGLLAISPAAAAQEELESLPVTRGNEFGVWPTSLVPVCRPQRRSENAITGQKSSQEPQRVRPTIVSSGLFQTFSRSRTPTECPR